ncbi:MAG: serine/threonine protein kinase [Aphanocapsa sp. GSE-SYN-MK-11-07L]|jgi:serine/threonine protein kinase|nr:serine/threonine protein kinase [Aphanocapsa sp. GSE-SYN-MK-11-07L]
MVCCLNPDCDRPFNSETQKFCQCCGDALTPLLKNRYQVVKPLGRGGFARTYLAIDQQTGQSCVVKQLAYRGTGAWLQENATHLFRQEAKQLEQLAGHPQIPQLVEQFSEDRSFYLVLTYIQGQDLKQELQQQGLFGDRKVRSLLLDLLPLLDFIHQRQVVHGDIKPENLVRSQTQKLVLIDFGIALATSERAGQRTVGLGSPGYAAPEQMEQAKVLPASDLFGLGITCVQLLTGQIPAELWSQHGYAWIKGWQQALAKPLSPQSTLILNRMVQPNLNQRYASATEVLKDLQFVSPSPNQAPQPKRKFWSRWFK